MPKNYFSIENAAALDQIPPGSKIHVSGISGVAMAQLAVALAHRGFQVSGSDKEFYEPMGSFLKSHPVRLSTGYSAANIPSDVALVVIGNALSYENEEVLEVERKGYRYTLFPKVLYDTVIAGRHSIVVTGTHGKSTTTALMAWLLTSLGHDPSYFIGAVVPDLPQSLHVGQGPISVVEGDEYDSAFFAKVPKFAFYRPATAIVTAIEYDHADIYPDLESIEREFSKLVAALPSKDHSICCIDDPNVERLVHEWRKSARCRIITYGENPAAEVTLKANVQAGLGQSVTLHGKSVAGIDELNFELAIPGVFNARNAAAVMIACALNGIEIPSAAREIRAFRGARRRQEVRVDNGDVVLIDDFAHHPTAVRETIHAIKLAYPGRRIVAIFEPRSNTSRRKVFQDQYVASFAEADQVVLCEVVSRAIDRGLELIAVMDLANSVKQSGVPAIALPDADAIHSYVIREKRKGDVIIVMSNGGFGGLVQKLEGDLSR